MISTPIMYGILANGTSGQMLVFGVIYTVICLMITGIGRVMYREDGEQPEAAL